MNRIRYVVGLIVFFAILSLCVWGSGGNLWVFLDVLSFIIVGMGTLALLRTGWTFREMGKAFALAFADTAERGELSWADAFFTTMGRYFTMSGLGGFFLGIVIMLKYLADKSMIGPNLAVALLSVLYAILFQLIIVIPMRALIQKKISASRAD